MMLMQAGDKTRRTKGAWSQAAAAGLRRCARHAGTSVMWCGIKEVGGTVRE